MKIVITIDSFKGSMTSMEAGNAAREGVRRVCPQAETVVMPLADGGEGTVEALLEGIGGERITVQVTGPMHTKVKASYGILEDGITAVMEMAQAAGLTLVNPAEKNPGVATTYGVGEMICDGVERGCRRFLIGIGGSATNDGGIGMLKALGVQFLTETGEDAGEGADALGKIDTILLDRLQPKLKECEFRIACDVNNPLCGRRGATYVYGKQKGIEELQMEKIDCNMAHYAEKTAEATGTCCVQKEGAGAAGGLGFAFVSYLGAQLVPGVELVLDAIHFRETVKEAALVITGEGRLDAQTAMGKAPVGVAKEAKKYDCKVLAFAGSVTEDAIACNKQGIDAFFPIVRGVCSLEEAMDRETAQKNMAESVEQVMRLL